jgi:hypothetical protein
MAYHPLFIEEERLCSQLQLTYEKYRLHVEAGALSSLKPKLWKNLQECRTRQKFRSTNAEVVVTTDSGKDSGGDDCVNSVV